MADPVRGDILKLFQANPLLRDTTDGIARRVGRAGADVQKALDALELEGVVAVRWVGGAALHFFTGASAAPSAEHSPDPAGASPPVSSSHGGPSKLEARLTMPSTLDGVHVGRLALENLCKAVGMDPGGVMELAIALSEALTNAFRYGRRGDGRDVITADLRVIDDHLEIKIKDRGSGFPFVLVGASQGDSKSTGGRGLMLMRSLTDDLSVTRGRSGTVVRMVKSLHPRPAGPAEENKPG